MQKECQHEKNRNNNVKKTKKNTTHKTLAKKQTT
jgi:hypothetical protein